MICAECSAELAPERLSCPRCQRLVHADELKSLAAAAQAAAATGDASAELASWRRALDLLGSRRSDASKAALATLREDTQQWWADTLARNPDELEADEAPVTPR